MSVNTVPDEVRSELVLDLDAKRPLAYDSQLNRCEGGPDQPG